MIRAIIVDDESDGRQATQMAVEKYCPDITLIKQCEKPEEAIQAISDLQPDLVFLDIQMPGMSGFDLLSQLDKINFEIIFISAFDQYAIKAIKFSALDYLLKPIDIDELVRAISKVKERMNKKEGSYRQQSILNNIRYKTGNMEKIAVPSLNGIDFFAVTDIIYCHSEADYTTLVLKGKRTELVSRNLKEFEDLLKPSGFCRVHQSYLVNMQHITRYIRGEGGQVILSEGYNIPVSRRKKDEFLQLLNKV